MSSAGNGKNPLNTLKLKNRREVLTLLRDASPISIAEMAARTSLSKVTVTKVLDHYRKEGLVVDAGKGAPTEERGKPPTFFALNPNHKYIFCVKIDGYNMLASLTNLQGKVIASHTALYDQGIDLQQLIQSITDSFAMLMERECIATEDCLAIVAGLHGVIDPLTGICFLSPQFPQWGHDIPMRDLLARNMPGVPVYVDNWVHYYGRGEVTAMREPLNRFLLISSEIEGLNGAMMVDGKLYRGHDCLAGEIGHMIVDSSENAEVCQCGGKGCFEAAVSPRRMVARIKHEVESRPESSLAGKGGTVPIAFRNIAEAADSGDEVARKAMYQSARFFAIGIRNLMQTYDPELVIIQGEYASAGSYFLEQVRALIPKTSLLGLSKTVRVEYSTLGPYGAITGAANYVADIFFDNA